MILWALGTALGMSQGELSVRSEGDRILMDWRSPSLTADSNAVLSPPGRLEFSDDLIQWEATGETAPQRLSGKAQSHRFTITSTSAVRFYRVVVEKFDLANANLSGRDLTGLDLSDMDLTGAKFDGATLDKANLTRSILTNASFVNVQAASANFGPTVGSIQNTAYGPETPPVSNAGAVGCTGEQSSTAHPVISEASAGLSPRFPVDADA